ncbi:hypothetical protein T484DRAFT_1649284, partial [Baffinella frigidus]
ENRPPKTENIPKTGTRKQKTENRGPKTENREQRTEDRKPKTGNREQRTEKLPICPSC